MSSNLLFLDICTEPAILRVILFIKLLVKYASIIIPIVLIIMLSIDIGKNVIAPDEEKMQRNLRLAFRRVLYCIFIFFVPTVVTVIITIVEDNISNFNVNYESCLTNTQNIEYYDEIKQLKKEEEEKQRQDENKKVMNEAIKKAQADQETKNKVSAKLREQTRAKLNAFNAIQETTIKEGTNLGNAPTATVIGQKYQLTDSQLRGLASQCQSEQPGAKGAAAEASLMANRFELFGGKYGSGGSGLYSYVRNSGWFAGSKSHMSNTSGVSPSVLAAVKEVLVLGKRSLALYVDEHDCISCGRYGYDIVRLNVNGRTITSHSELKNHSNYIQDKTVIYNKYGSVYTFYSFPTPSSDPFGYTSQAKNKYDSMNH